MSQKWIHFKPMLKVLLNNYMDTRSASVEKRARIDLLGFKRSNAR